MSRSKSSSTRRTPAKTARSRRAKVSKAPKTRTRSTSGQRSLAMRILAGTTRGTARVAFVTTPQGIGRASVKTWRWVKQQRERTKFADKDYEPERGEIPSSSFRQGQQCRPCRKKFRTLDDLNTHFMREHAHEEAEPRRERRPTELIPRGRKGKLRVVPGGAVAGGGRHRKTGPARRNERRSKKIAAAQQAAFRRKGERAVVEMDALVKIKAGFSELAEKPMTYRDDQPFLPLSELAALAAGMELILGGSAVDAMSNVRALMIRAGFPPEATTPLLRISGDFGEIATAFTRWISVTLEELDEQIKAARKLHGVDGPSSASLVS